MATRSAKGSQTKDRIIRTAAQLFHAKGLHATSPDDIIEASDTGKGQFYHYFKNKEGLIHEVLTWHLDLARRGEAPIKYEIGSWDDLEAWFYAHIELQKSFGMTRGCPFGTAANEVTVEEEAIRQDLGRIFDYIKDRLVVFFRNEQRRERFVPDANAERLADFCIAALQSAMLLGKVRLDPEPAEAVVREALTHVKRYVISGTLGSVDAMTQTVELYGDRLSTYARDDRHGAIVLRWSAATRDMSEDQFRAGLERLAGLIKREGVRNALIDVVEFAYRPSRTSPSGAKRT
jgi:AcrR family transcriptional regulator